MPEFIITAPDGKKYRVKGQGSREEALAHLQSQLGATEEKPVSQAGNFLDPIMQGVTSGWSDELMGAVGGGLDALRGKRSYSEGYEFHKEHARRNLEGFQERNPKTAMALEIGGALPAAAIPFGAAARGASLGARIGRGAATGAAAAGVYGAGAADDGAANRALGATTGVLAGGLTGGALPVATAGVGAVLKPVRDAVSARVNPAGYAARKVTERINNQGISVGQAANRMSRARQGGQSMSLMDVGGDSVRDLARTTTNIPGPARNRITANANIGAMGQGDRLRSIVNTTIADPDGYLAAKDQIIAARSQAATPFYNRAWRTPITFSHELEAILDRPAVRQALVNARNAALNRGDDPAFAQWLANIADDGSISLRNVPGLRDLHYVKMALDDAVEGAMNPATSPFARPRATVDSRAIGSARDSLRRLMDAAGETAPGRGDGPYAQAARVALDNIQADEAIEFGRRALNTDARINAREFGRMNAGQQEIARIGVAEAMRDKIDRAGFTHNAVLRLFSSREQIARIRPFFRSNEDWATFRQAMFNEARKRKSYEAIRGNSTTARQLLDAQDAGQLGEVAQTVTQAARGGLVSATIGVLERGLRRLGGLTPRTAEEMARLLATRDPQRVRGIVRELQRVEASRMSNEQRLTTTRQILSNLVAGQEGRMLSAPSSR